MRLGIALLIFCACHGGTDPAETRDPGRIFEVRRHGVTHRDDPFPAEVVTQFRTTDVLEDLDVRALAVADGTVYAGTASGLFRLTGERFERAAEGTVVDLFPRDGGGLWVATDRAIFRAGERFAISGVTAIAALDGELFAGTARALVTVSAAGTSTIAALEVRDLAVSSGALVVAAKTGVFRLDGRALIPIGGPWHEEPLALASGDSLWVATDRSLLEIGGRTFVPEPDGLPATDHRALAVGRGQVMIGHAIGASAIRGSKIEHYHSLRWIPAEEVRAVAIGGDGSRWIGTSAGVSRIAYQPTTLLEKAEALDATIDPIHIRMDGFVNDDVFFDDPYDHSLGPRPWDNDNDGLWTEMQVGTWCFAYAVTGDVRYKRKARRSLDVMFLEIDVPGETFAANGRSRGFIARSLVRDDEGFLFDSKVDQENFHRQDFGGRTYYWKGDTSSDEYAGHYFGMPVYYDLCADRSEREEIATRMALATDYVIEGGYQLIGLDGTPTSFGRWNDLAAAVDGLDGCPDRFDLYTCINSWGGGGWLNSLEILGMLLSTWHITGDDRYYEEYERLFVDERYGELIPITEDTLTVTNPRFANHSDHELATLAYFTLLRYEPNQDRRDLIVRSFLDFYEHEREEHNPWQVATIALAYEPDVDLAGAITTLQDMPLDRRNWTIDNAHRKDAKLGPADREGAPQFDRVFPYDEINALKWNSDPYNVSDGWGMGRDVISPTPYLISYWMARYAGLIE